jgi:hypothetical protein
MDPVPDPLLFFLVVPGIEPGPPDLYLKNNILSFNGSIEVQLLISCPQTFIQHNHSYTPQPGQAL